MFHERIREGFDVFLHDGEKAFGAVRRVRKNEIVVYVENAGDFVVPMSAIVDVDAEKVTLNEAKLDPKLRAAIAGAHRREDPRV